MTSRHSRSSSASNRVALWASSWSSTEENQASLLETRASRFWRRFRPRAAEIGGVANHAMEPGRRLVGQGRLPGQAHERLLHHVFRIASRTPLACVKPQRRGVRIEQTSQHLGPDRSHSHHTSSLGAPGRGLVRPLLSRRHARPCFSAMMPVQRYAFRSTSENVVPQPGARWQPPDALSGRFCMPRRAEIIAIGSELVSGQALDTNSQWLSRELGELGISGRVSHDDRRPARGSCLGLPDRRRPGRPGDRDRRTRPHPGRSDARGAGRPGRGAACAKTPARSRRSGRCSRGETGRWPSGTRSRPSSPKGPSRCPTAWAPPRASGWSWAQRPSPPAGDPLRDEGDVPRAGRAAIEEPELDRACHRPSQDQPVRPGRVGHRGRGDGPDGPRPGPRGRHHGPRGHHQLPDSRRGRHAGRGPPPDRADGEP